MKLTKLKVINLFVSCALGILLTTASWPKSAHSENSLKQGNDGTLLAKLDNLLMKGECKKTWSVLWPRLVEKDTIALRDFSKLSLKYYFRLPSQSDDQLTFLRRLFILSVYGFDHKDPDSRQIALDVLNGLPIFSSSAQSLSTCFANAKTNADVAVCQSEAQQSRMVPRYQEFLSELRKESASTGDYSCNFVGDEFSPNQAR